MKSIKYTDLLLEEMEKNFINKEQYENSDARELLDYIKETENPDMNEIEQIAKSMHISLPETIELCLQFFHKCLNKEGVLDELMTTSAASVSNGMQYYTPMAFSSTNEPSKKIKKISTMFGMTPVKKTNRWFKKLDNETGKPINEINLNTTLYKRMLKINKGDL